jgi:hypothetical protein
MKKIASVVLALIALFALTVTPALAASGQLFLRETRNDRGGGVIFIFEYTGDFTDADFEGGSVLYNGQYYPLDCNIAEGVGEVWCTASRALAGHQVQVFLAGFIFWDKVPEGGRGFGQICYEVWYWDTASNNDGLDWYLDATSHCQDAPASYGDVIFLTAPPYTWTDNYYFWYESDTHPGNGCNGFVSSVVGDVYYEECNSEIFVD